MKKSEKIKYIVISVIFFIVGFLVSYIVFLDEVYDSLEMEEEVGGTIQGNYINNEINVAQEYSYNPVPSLDMNNQEIPEKGLKFFSDGKNREIWYRMDGKIDRQVNTYEHGSVTINEITYTYKDNGQIEKSTFKVLRDDYKPELVNQTIDSTYEYSNDGKLMKVFENLIYATGGRIITQNEVINYTYDYRGRLTEEEGSSVDDKNPTLNYSREYEYDSNGRLARKNSLSFESGYDITYIYSNDGRLIREEAKSNGLGDGYCTEHHYDNDNKLYKSLLYYWRCGVEEDKSREIKYFYRQDGKIERKTEYYFHNESAYTTTYEYYD